MSAADQPAAAPGRRVSTRLVVAVFAILFAALAAGYYFYVQPAYVDAFTGVRPADTAALVAQLEAKGIPYRLGSGGSTVAVPETRLDAARVAIAASDVPLHGGIGFELFNKADMGLTDFAQKINYQRALQGELERTILMIDGIESARVHLAIPERSIFRAERTPAKAAIELVARPGVTLDADRIAGLQRLVANSVPELTPGDVVVVDGEGRALAGRDDAATGADPLGEQQQALQHYYRARIRAALASALPGIRLDVRVLVAPGTGAATNGAAGGVPGGERDFALRVTVSTDEPLPTDRQAAARTACVQAIGGDAALADEISFVVGVPESSAGDAPAPSASAAVSLHVPAPGGVDPTVWWPWLAGAAMIAVAAMLFLGYRLTARAHEADDQRADLAARLRRALDETADGYAR